MSPQTRRFLDLILAAVRSLCVVKQIEQPHYRFTQRDVRGWANASSQQVKRHLAKLVELEYILIHRGGRGQSFVYELLYSGEGDEGGKFIMGLIDPEKLKESSKIESDEVTYDNNRDTQNSYWDTPGTPQVQWWNISGSLHQNGSIPSKQAELEAILTNRVEKHPQATP